MTRRTNYIQCIFHSKVNLEMDPRSNKNMLKVEKLAELFEKNGESFGIEFCKDKTKTTIPAGSTDMGNVSHEVPSIHPMFYIGGTSPNHTRDFTADAGENLTPIR